MAVIIYSSAGNDVTIGSASGGSPQIPIEGLELSSLMNPVIIQAGISQAGTIAWGSIVGIITQQTDLMAYFADYAPTANPVFTGNVIGVTASMVGLSNVLNIVQEPSLGNPAGNNYFLTSTTTGIRSWTPISASVFWGAVTGTLANQTDLVTALSGKEPSITIGTISQYWRGDKTFQTLNTSVVPEGTAQYYTNARVLASTLTNFTATTGSITSVDTVLSALEKVAYALTTVQPTITSGTTSQYFRGDLTWQILNAAAVGLNNVNNTADNLKAVLSATMLVPGANINGVTFTGATNITITDSTKEPSLGNPSANGYVLSSTTGGIRSWVAQSSGSSGMTNPMTTIGDIIIGNALGNPSRLGIGTSGQILTVVSGSPNWTTPSTSITSNILQVSGTTFVPYSTLASISTSPYLYAQNLVPALASVLDSNILGFNGILLGTGYTLPGGTFTSYSGTGIKGTSTSGVGGTFTSSSGNGIYALSTTGIPGIFNNAIGNTSSIIQAQLNGVAQCTISASGINLITGATFTINGINILNGLSPTINITFSGVFDFSNNYSTSYADYTVASNISITSSSTKVNGSTCVICFIGDGTHAPVFTGSGFYILSGSNTYNSISGARNVITLSYIGTKVYYSISNSTGPQ